MSAFPPTRSYASIPVSTDAALKRLQEYLSAAQTNPYLLPNAALQSDGPRAQTQSANNLVIHNLERVEAGLRGEWLAPSMELEGGTDALGRMELGNGLGGEFPVNSGLVDDAEGWQDLDEYQREQSIEEGDVGPAEKLFHQVGNETIEGNKVLGERSGKAVDKEARKREKRERLKQLKRDKSKKLRQQDI